MARYLNNKRRESTIVRDNNVINAYILVMKDLGELSQVVSKSYVYEKVRKKTGLCTKTIAFLNFISHKGIIYSLVYFALIEILFSKFFD